MSKLLKIGFAGNTNNYPFTLALAFDKLGHDVKFLIDSDIKLHRPENRFNINEKNNIKTLDLSPIEFNEYLIPISEDKLKQVHSFFRDRDIVILNSHFISLFNHINRPHLTLLTGSDLDYLASVKYKEDFDTTFLNPRLKSERLLRRFNLIDKLSFLFKAEVPSDRLLYSKNELLRLVALSKLKKNVYTKCNNQGKAIKSAPFLIYFPKGLIPAGEKVLTEIGAQNNKRVFNLMTDVHQIKFTPLKQHNKPIRIFNVARFNWNKETAPAFFTELDFKGNDKMIKGIALFLKTYPDISLEIILVRKGANLSETYKLIEDLGISDKITWVDEMSQAQVIEEYEKADIVFDQLSTSLVGMGGLDALSVGRPLIANWRPEYMESFFGKWPVCQAQDEHEVFNWLKELILNSDKRISIGNESRAFVEKHLSSEAFAKRIIDGLIHLN